MKDNTTHRNPTTTAAHSMPALAVATVESASAVDGLEAAMSFMVSCTASVLTAAVTTPIANIAMMSNTATIPCQIPASIQWVVKSQGLCPGPLAFCCSTMTAVSLTI